MSKRTKEWAHPQNTNTGSYMCKSEDQRMGSSSKYKYRTCSYMSKSEDKLIES